MDKHDLGLIVTLVFLWGIFAAFVLNIADRNLEPLSMCVDGKLLYHVHDNIYRYTPTSCVVVK